MCRRGVTITIAACAFSKCNVSLELAEDHLGKVGKMGSKKGTRAAKRSVLQSPSVAQEKERRESCDSDSVASLALLYLDQQVLSPKS